MHINGKSDPDPIFINGVNLEYVSDMKYLGSIKEEKGSCSKDVKTSRIAMAKKKNCRFKQCFERQRHTNFSEN